ncbi:expressed unknown protein [Seminavis robusta]|uniref:Uncharacterized protein n=1 Tax=Seminavis robusta TaxID=568900 RepID=A0A9N8DGA7_9STRA|nr:expressed unknown protein [Seminavis robusta]|eukprot:Sro54_g031880.1 n/a (291) ;mRNA; r:69872-70983
MASWTLGKIFSVDEEEQYDDVKETIPESDDDDGSDSEDDEDAMAAQAAFNKNKQNSSSARHDDKAIGSSRSIRRYDEYGDFISRSERARAEKSLSGMHAAHTESQQNEKAGKRRVSFAPDESLVTSVHEIPLLTDEDKQNCFMTAETWQSMDTDMDITIKRWQNHKEGLIKFDEDNNTIRGIEDIVFRLDKNKPIYKHRKTVLEEVVRQKMENEYPNMKKLSAISEVSSSTHREQAKVLGLEDEKERKRVWSPKPLNLARAISAPVAGSKKKKDKSKRKGSIFGFFSKKK